MTHQPPSEVTRRKPWRLNSQFWVAFFGGPLAVSVISFVNAQRLEDARAARRVLLLSLLVTGVGLAASCALVAFDGPRWADRPTTFGFALLLYLLVRRELLAAERVYEKGGNSFGSLVLPGLAAVVAGALISGGIKLVLLGVFSD